MRHILVNSKLYSRFSATSTPHPGEASPIDEILFRRAILAELALGKPASEARLEAMLVSLQTELDAAKLYNANSYSRPPTTFLGFFCVLLVPTTVGSRRSTSPPSTPLPPLSSQTQRMRCCDYMSRGSAPPSTRAPRKALSGFILGKRRRIKRELSVPSRAERKRTKPRVSPSTPRQSPHQQADLQPVSEGANRSQAARS